MHKDGYVSISVKLSETMCCAYQREESTKQEFDKVFCEGLKVILNNQKEIGEKRDEI